MKQLIESFRNILFYFFPVLGTIQLERLVNEPGNEMWRAGGGFHGYRRYFRIDWRNRGWRWLVPVDFYKDFWERLYPSLTPFGQSRCDELIENLRLEGEDSPELHPQVNVVRAGGMVIRERVDLWSKVWTKASQLQRDKQI